MGSTGRFAVILPLIVAGLAGSCAPSGPAMKIDGDIREWDAQSAAVADSTGLMLRFRVPKGPNGEPWTLQDGPKTVALYLDIDGSTATGRTSRLKPLNQLGVDCEIRFSPFEKGKPVPGAKTFRVAADGSLSSTPNATTGMIVSPTYASEWYEARLDRKDLVTFSGGAFTGKLAGMFVTLDDAGEIDGYADPFVVELPPQAVGPGPVVDVPGKPAGTVRVVSLNVEKSKPTKEPGAFSRMLTLLNADVVLFQEWEEGGASQTEEWFRTHAVGIEADSGVPGAPVRPAGMGLWCVHKTAGTGVGVASRWPMTALPPDSLEVSNPADKDNRPRRVRVASVMVKTPAGPLAVTSLHLKCCGGATGSEENLRRDEARAINKALGQMYASEASGAVARIVAGDFNLVGTRMPLDLMRAAVDADGSDMTPAEPFALGTGVKYTWRDDATAFLPGRLDYLLYSDATADVVQCFVMDTANMSFESLARSGLDATDSRASDHMPVVVDLKIK